MLARRLFTVALLISALASATALAQTTPGIQWNKDLEAAKLAAKQSGKLVLVHFWSESCGPCVRLDKTVFNQPQVASAIDQHFVPVKMNASEFPATAQAFGINRIPTDVVITPEGNVVEKLISPATPMAYVGKMTEIASLASGKQSRFQLAAAQSPYGDTTSGVATGSKTINNAYANLAIPTGTPASQSPAAASVAPAKTPAGNNVSPYDRYAAAGDRYGVPAQQTAPQAPITPIVEETAPATTAPVAVTPVTPAQLAPSSVDNPYTAPATQVAAATTPPAGPTAETTTDAGQQIELPPGAPPLGFEGFCPITMKREWRWVKGDPQFGIIHRGRTYLFASGKERDEFFKNPEAYAPILSGIDPVVALEEGKAVEGLRKHALEYRGQFYLFSSEQTLNKFWGNAENYLQGVRQAMNGAPTQQEKIVR